MKSSTKTMLALHILLAVYSVGNVFSKLAADVPFLSPRFILYYGIVLLILGIYAIGWQQVIKRMPLTTVSYTHLRPCRAAAGFGRGASACRRP